LKIPKGVTGVPSEILDPSKSWADKAVFKTSLTSLAEAFIKNFSKFKDENSQKYVAAGPQLK
jgi:phosphoenolpyruvate carboxykinase (ATP)